MKNFETIKQQFEDAFENVFINTWKEAIKSGCTKSVKCLLNSDNEYSFTTAKDVDIKDVVATIVFSEDVIPEIVKVSLDELVERLTDDGRRTYIAVQNAYIEREDWLFYNIKELMRNWIITKYPEVYAKAIEDRLIKRYESYKKSDMYAMFIKDISIRLLENIAKHKNEQFGRQEPKQPKQDTYVDRLKFEAAELQERIQALTAFIESNEIFIKLSDIEKNLLVKQLDVMKKYFKILDKRLIIANAKEV